MKITKLRKILIALDYDPTAQKVAEVGYSLAMSLEAEVVLVHVISDPLNYNSSKQFTVMGFAGYQNSSSEVTNDAGELRKESQLFLDKSKHHLGSRSIKTMIKVGNLAESILQAAEEVHADIIIIGSYKHKSNNQAETGNITYKVLESASIPLFIIPITKSNIPD